MPKQKLPDKEFQWTQDLAYIIGLLVTDGNLSKDGRHITMRSSEIEMLETFIKCLHLKNKIGSTDNQRGYRVQFGNVQFYNWLLKIGLFPAKTYTIGKISVPDEFFRDFVRGHLDGDGSIRSYEDRYNTYRGRTYANQRLFLTFISASKVHIIWLQMKIQQLASLKGALMTSKPKFTGRVPISILKFSKKDSIKLLDWIYYQPSLPSLIRKRQLAERALNIIAQEKRKEYNRI
ncbi:MAG: hypothetical protein Q8P97_02395 [bacterium]|nr:hypothetical protein [bacterium]